MTKTLFSTLLLLGVTAGLTSATAAAQNLAVNGDFETGDVSGWQDFPSPSSTFTVTSDANSGGFAGRIFNDFAPSAGLVKQANVGAGVVNNSASVTISFAAKGEGMNGGVAFAELFTELAGGGVSSAELLSGGPLALTSSWQNFSFTTTGGPDAAGGLTLQFVAVTGAVAGSQMELFIDDVVITATGGVPPMVTELSPFSEDFESLDQASGAAISDAGWFVAASVFNPMGDFLYFYGNFPAPNGTPGFCSVADGQGGPDQGVQQLVTYSDYNNADHGNGFTIESNVFREQRVGATDVGKTFTFEFDAKLGDIVAPSTALAFIKIIDSTVFSIDGISTFDTTALPTTWGTYSVSITIEPQHVGDFFQTGFQTNATNFNASGIFYDNLVFGEEVSLGTNYCLAAANSSGLAGVMSASGSDIASENNFTLTASELPTGQMGLFVAGSAARPAVQLPTSNGSLCLDGQIGRFAMPTQILNSGAAGSFSLQVDLTSIPQGAGFVPTISGQTWFFQAWFRDTNVGLGSNLSDGLEVIFQ